MRIYKHWALNRDIVLHEGDCLDLLKGLPDGSVDLVLTSPPYCIGKVYEDQTKAEDFVSNHEQILPEIVRVVKPGGSICWQVGYHVSNRVVTPLDFIVYRILSEHKNIFLRNRIIWTFGHGLHSADRFSGRHESIMWFTKGHDYHFDLDEVRVPQKYPGKRHYKGDKKGDYSGNPLGKNPSDVWEIPNVKANHVEKTDHPCQFPIELANRLIKSMTKQDGIVLDPYLGSGTSAASAIMCGRKFVGSEIDPKYAEIAKRRIREALEGSLRFRPDDTPIYEPKPNSRLTKTPQHWKAH